MHKLLVILHIQATSGSKRLHAADLPIVHKTATVNYWICYEDIAQWHFHK